MFGFPGKIAHGNHVVAMLLEIVRRGSVTATLDRGMGLGPCVWQSEKSLWIEVEFRRPMVLPVRLGIEFAETNGDWEQAETWRRFRVTKGRKVVIEGSWGQI